MATVTSVSPSLTSASPISLSSISITSSSDSPTSSNASSAASSASQQSTSAASSLLSSTTPPAPSTTSPASPAETKRPRGLTITTTIGIGIGVAAICVIIFIIGFVCVRRRRRKFGLKRKERMELGLEGDSCSPEDEIAKKLERSEASKEGGAVEAGGTAIHRAELGAGAVATDEKKQYVGGGRPVSELPSEVETTVQELPGQEQPVEMGDGGFFIAELDSKEIERMKSLKATRRPAQDAEAPPLPSPKDAGDSSPSKDEEDTSPKGPPIPDIVIQAPEEKTP